MPQRGYVLIFFFWALLTVITPTLVFWSASAKPSLYLQEEARVEIMKARRMLTAAHSKPRMKPAWSIAPPAPAPAPAPAPGPVAGGGNDTAW